MKIRRSLKRCFWPRIAWCPRTSALHSLRCFACSCCRWRHRALQHRAQAMAVSVSEESTELGWSSVFVIFIVFVSNILLLLFSSCCFCCYQRCCNGTHNSKKSLLDERVESTVDLGDRALLKIISDHEREIEVLKRTIKCRDEENETLRPHGINHDVWITQGGHKWHQSSKCASVRSASASKRYEACKHCTRTGEPK